MKHVCINRAIQRTNKLGKYSVQSYIHYILTRNTTIIIITIIFFFYKEDLLTYKNLQKYATKYIHMYNINTIRWQHNV